MSGQILLFALLGGILPALLWLWFWLKEDRARPEPRGLILLSFIAGMITVAFVIPLERAAEFLSIKAAATLAFVSAETTTVLAWATIEEVSKYIVGVLVVLKRKANDEPIDAIIYMITIALGFAALENTLFLLNPLGSGDLPGSILTGNLRFLGATLLHTLSSGVVGAAMAFSFYKSGLVKKLYVSLGLLLAIVLHSVFNFIIIVTNGEKLLAALLFVWAGIVLLILLFEKVKRIKNPTFFS